MKPYTLTPKAKAVVKKAIANIRSKPDQFDMGHWVGRNHAPKLLRSCGTSACAAGHIVLAAGLKVNKIGSSVKLSDLQAKFDINASKIHTFTHANSNIERVEVENAAEAILNLDGNAIFYADNWPSPFREEFEALTYVRPVTKTVLKKRAALAIKVLQSLLPAHKKSKKS